MQQINNNNKINNIKINFYNNQIKQGRTQMLRINLQELVKMMYFLKNCSNKIKKYNKLKQNIKKQIKKKLFNHKHKIKKIINK